MSVKTQFLYFYRQEPCPFSKCTCDSAYNKMCNEEGNTPELYIGMNDDYCEISTVDGTEVRKYCECNMDVFTYKKTGVYPFASCIDEGPDDRINQRVYVCYFDNDTAKNVVCPSCQKCTWNNVSSTRYQVSRSFDSKE